MTESGVQQPGASPWAVSYAYDLARRLTNEVSEAGDFAYNYDGGADLGWLPDPYTGIYSELHAHAGSLVQTLLLPGGAYITNTFDNVARETGTWLLNSGGTNLDSYAYAYNQANQRTGVIVTNFSGIVKTAELASQGFPGFGRTAIVICSRIAAL